MGREPATEDLTTAPGLSPSLCSSEMKHKKDPAVRRRDMVSGKAESRKAPLCQRASALDLACCPRTSGVLHPR